MFVSSCEGRGFQKLLERGSLDHLSSHLDVEVVHVDSPEIPAYLIAVVQLDWPGDPTASGITVPPSHKMREVVHTDVDGTLSGLDVCDSRLGLFAQAEVTVHLSPRLSVPMLCRGGYAHRR